MSTLSPGDGLEVNEIAPCSIKTETTASWFWCETTRTHIYLCKILWSLFIES